MGCIIIIGTISGSLYAAYLAAKRDMLEWKRKWELLFRVIKGFYRDNGKWKLLFRECKYCHFELYDLDRLTYGLLPCFF